MDTIYQYRAVVAHPGALYSKYILANVPANTTNATLQGTADGVTWTTIPWDQYRIGAWSGAIVERILDDSNNPVDWSAYIAWQDAGNQAFRITYTVSNSGVRTTYTNESLTFDYGGFNPIQPDGTTILEFGAYLAATVLISAGGSVSIDDNGITITEGAPDDHKIKFINSSGVTIFSFFANAATGQQQSNINASGDSVLQDAALYLLSSSYSASSVKISLLAYEASAQSHLRIAGTGFQGITVGVDANPNAMLDVRGDIIATGGHIGAGASQLHVIPAVTADTLALLAAAQTLTNKTLTSPVVNTQLTGTAVGTGASQVAAGNHTSPVFVASGASHAAGHVPDPGSSSGTAKFLREDATWASPAASKYTIQGNAGGDTFSGTIYLGPGIAANGAEDKVKITIPFACTLSNFSCRTSTTQPHDQPLTLTVNDNGTGTALVITVPIDGTANVYSDTSDTITWTAYHEFSIKKRTTSVSASAAVWGWSVEVTPI